MKKGERSSGKGGKKNIDLAQLMCIFKNKFKWQACFLGKLDSICPSIPQVFVLSLEKEKYIFIVGRRPLRSKTSKKKYAIVFISYKACWIHFETP